MVQFIDLWRGHPVNESVTTPCIAPHDLTNINGQQVREGDAVFANEAAIRMGIALRRVGISITELGSITTCGVHPPSDMHIVNAADLAAALRRVRLPGFAPVEVVSGDEVREFYSKIVNRTGVIYIKDYWMREGDTLGQPTGDHIDVWNGYRTSGNWLMEWFSWTGYYSNYTGAREIWFWEVK
jgi:hypothetical protein